MTTSVPTILIVDDEPELQRSTLDLLDADLASSFKVLGPDEIKESDLKQANLVLVDFKLDEWKQPVATDLIASYIPNGVALTTVLRQRVKKAEKPIAFAIHTAVPEELAEPLVYSDRRSHILARINNLDWVFQKNSGSDPTSTYKLCRQLAHAVSLLPPDWPIDDPARSRSKAESLLLLDRSASWAENAWDDVERCRPPLDELTQPAHGLLFMRWLLQKALPYPAFLLDEYQIAAKLCASVHSVRDALSGKLSELLSPIRYTGILSDFLGPRWWRAGFGLFIRTIAGGELLTPDEVRDVLISKHEVHLVPLATVHAVVCLDRDYRPMDILEHPENCVRILPDEWPHYADMPWTTTEEAATTHLRNIVIDSDRSQ